MGVLRSKSSFLQDQQVLLTAGPSLPSDIKCSWNISSKLGYSLIVIIIPAWETTLCTVGKECCWRQAVSLSRQDTSTHALLLLCAGQKCFSSDEKCALSCPCEGAVLGTTWRQRQAHKQRLCIPFPHGLQRKERPVNSQVLPFSRCSGTERTSARGLQQSDL